MNDNAHTPVVLLVEDEWLVRMEIADALAEQGWLVEEAGSGEAAMAYLACEKPLDILITDIRLAGPLDGWDVAQAGRRAFPELPVIYASASPRDDSRMVPGGVFLGKPSRTELLVTVCKRLLGPAGTA
ncbi:MAG: response regulator [Rhizomicrobium sp.]